MIRLLNWIFGISYLTISAWLFLIDSFDYLTIFYNLNFSNGVVAYVGYIPLIFRISPWTSLVVFFISSIAMLRRKESAWIGFQLAAMLLLVERITATFIFTYLFSGNMVDNFIAPVAMALVALIYTNLPPVKKVLNFPETSFGFYLWLSVFCFFLNLIPVLISSMLGLIS